VTLRLPALRQRVDDVPRLAEYFRERFMRDLGKPVVGFGTEATAALKRHEWPGNVEELENVVERCVVLTRGPRVEADVVQRAILDATMPRPAAATPQGRPAASKNIRPLKEALEEPEKRIILQALEALNWNRQETARVLDINRTTLYKKMKKYGLLFDEPAWVN
jgi:two-component system response regulator HydG